MELVKMYINQGRFGEFVNRIIELENQRRKEEAEKEDEDRLWIAYVHSMSEKSFVEWRNGLQQQPVKKPSLSMTKEEVEEAKQRVRGILKGFSPK